LQEITREKLERFMMNIDLFSLTEDQADTIETMQLCSHILKKELKKVRKYQKFKKRELFQNIITAPCIVLNEQSSVASLESVNKSTSRAPSPDPEETAHTDPEETAHTDPEETAHTDLEYRERARNVDSVTFWFLIVLFVLVANVFESSK
jgi:hypothetical protein